MKLVVAIIHDEDAHDLILALSEAKFGVTKLASTGGFLRAGNTTILVGVEVGQVDLVLEKIKENCKVRKEITTSSAMMSEASGFMTMPIEVTVGGATVFILDVSQYFKF
jgi:uncharacterized protein YaaQ